MTQLIMSLFKYKDILPSFSAGHHGLYLLSGAIKIGDKIVNQGEGHYINGAEMPDVVLVESAEFLHVCVSAQSVQNLHGQALSEDTIEVGDDQMIFRLDQVSFPIGSCAYRHVHHGAGIRYLKEGELEITSDHSTDLIKTGMAWFEPSHSPVRATPQNEEPACFIRAMLIPKSFEGKPTIKYLNAEDEARPKFQKTQRFFDQVVSFDRLV